MINQYRNAALFWRSILNGFGLPIKAVLSDDDSDNDIWGAGLRVEKVNKHRAQMF